MIRVPPGAVILDPGEVDYVARALVEFVAAMAPRSPSPTLLATIEKLRRAGESADSLAVADHRKRTRSPELTGERRASQPVSRHAGPHEDIGTAEAARRLGITPNGVRDLVRRGRLEVRRAGGRWLVDAASVDAYAQRRVARRGG